ncbi:MAG: ATP-binding protein [Candidatus Poribacteria bacterium]|nr:ATP-binding protein [Candidatus Poribacteria bacterium]
MRIAVDPLAGKTLHSDGSNLPIVVRELQKQGPKRFDWWIKHLRTDLHDLDNLTVETLSDTKRLYLVYHTVGGAKIPHWQLSDGTLRFLALTLIAYMPNNDGIYLIEEPENGIHPLAIEAVYQSLSSVYEGQVFLATHSPLLVGLAKPEELLCFDKAKDGATQIVRGDQHPRLKEWHREVSLGTLFASGVFGGA